MRRDDEAPYTVAGGSKGRGGPVAKDTPESTFAGEIDGVPVPDLQHTAEHATLPELALAVDELAFVHTETYFLCPRCRRRSAHLRGSAEWSCGVCRRDSTIFELRRIVQESPAALLRLHYVVRA